ncbi:hypothetical protein [Micromonospora sp. HK10]|uniref:hypothetical protein n=1 Tax=Micromonospora sp. HK10 TaxID=1538294 RepID=UPI0012E179CA|nr:hypothetical protein [Micromonospora sp. HK10]
MTGANEAYQHEGGVDPRRAARWAGPVDEAKSVVEEEIPRRHVGVQERVAVDQFRRDELLPTVGESP